jgi:hypothetical protein
MTARPLGAATLLLGICCAFAGCTPERRHITAVSARNVARPAPERPSRYSPSTDVDYVHADLVAFAVLDDDAQDFRRAKRILDECGVHSGVYVSLEVVLSVRAVDREPARRVLSADAVLGPRMRAQASRWK